MTYDEERACAEVLESLILFRFGPGLRVRVKPDPDAWKAANQQAAYGLARVDRNSRQLLELEPSLQT